MALFLQSGMDAGEIREQDPALLLFMLYTAVVGSLTEASVLNAVVGKGQEPGIASPPRARGGRVRAERAPARVARVPGRSVVHATATSHPCELQTSGIRSRGGARGSRDQWLGASGTAEYASAGGSRMTRSDARGTGVVRPRSDRRELGGRGPPLVQPETEHGVLSRHRVET
jgi:hypothetical protein